VTIKKPLRSFEQRFEDYCLRLHAFCTVFEGDQAAQYQSRKTLSLISPPGNEEVR